MKDNKIEPVNSVDSRIEKIKEGLTNGLIAGGIQDVLGATIVLGLLFVPYCLFLLFKKIWSFFVMHPKGSNQEGKVSGESRQLIVLIVCLIVIGIIGLMQSGFIDLMSYKVW